MNSISVFQYINPIAFLQDFLGEKQKNDSSFSVRKWAKEMGLKSHSLLVMLLQEKRVLKIQHTEFIQKSLNFNDEEKSYFQTLIQYKNAKNIEEKRFIQKQLDEINPNFEVKTREIDEFILISDWIHSAIMAMTELKNFQGTVDEIYLLVQKKVTKNDIRAAINRLIEMELIKKNDHGKLVATCNRLTTKDNVKNDGARKYHKQVIDLAKTAIDDQDLLEREFQSFSMAIDKEKVQLAIDMIRKFRKQLSKAVSGNGDFIYQTNIQFFQLAKDPKITFEDSQIARDNKPLESI